MASASSTLGHVDSAQKRQHPLAYVLRDFLAVDEWQRIIDVVVTKLSRADPFYPQHVQQANAARRTPDQGLRYEVYQIAVRQYSMGETRGLPVAPTSPSPEQWLLVLRELAARRFVAHLVNRAALARSRAIGVAATLTPGLVQPRTQSLIRRRFGNLQATEGWSARGSLFWS